MTRHSDTAMPGGAGLRTPELWPWVILPPPWSNASQMCGDSALWSKTSLGSKRLPNGDSVTQGPAFWPFDSDNNARMPLPAVENQNLSQGCAAPPELWCGVFWQRPITLTHTEQAGLLEWMFHQKVTKPVLTYCKYFLYRIAPTCWNWVFGNFL